MNKNQGSVTTKTRAHVSWTSKATGYGSGFSGISNHDSQTTKTRTHMSWTSKTIGCGLSRISSHGSGLVEPVPIDQLDQ